ncbi:unnamed protein product [Brassica rapa]|uniref:Uncharacterized protein n=1 Tax=Brassica campestris TaxID=3711 RepID=A0A8D9M5T7_BRACM|nr:unnamed protein product [Brassica rapa]
MRASPCLLQPPCLALPPPHNSHCDHRCLVSSTIKLLLHHHLPLQKTNKNQIQREREKDRQREICRTVVEWW